MYRAPDATPRCSACGNANLTPATKFDTSEGFPNVYFEKAEPETGFFASNTETFAVDRARVCLDCGHVMFSFSSDKLATLRAHLPRLKPMT